MAIQDSYPTLYAASLQRARESSRVWSLLANRDYQNEISKRGDSVIISSMGDVNISDYSRSGGMTGQQLDTTVQDLTITEDKYFNFIVQDVDLALSNANLREEAGRKAAYGLDVACDAFLAGIALAEGTVAVGTTASPVELSATGGTDSTAVYDLLVDLATELDEADVPEAGRWVVMAPKYRALLRKDTDRFDVASPEMAKNGMVGRCAGFDVYATNRSAKSGSVDAIVAGHSDSLSFAEAIPPSAVRMNPSLQFRGTQIDGQHLYGATVTRASGVQIAWVAVA